MRRYFPFLFKFQSAVGDICSMEAGEKRLRIYYDLYLDLHARDTRLRSAAFSWKSTNKFWKIKSLFLEVWPTGKSIFKGRLQIKNVVIHVLIRSSVNNKIILLTRMGGND